MSKSIKEIADIAASWWTDAVAVPKFDNGDTSEAGAFGSLLATLNTKAVSSEQADKFKAALVDSIQSKLKTSEHTMTLGVDYGPDQLLAEAAESIGIPVLNFPWKTCMWISRDRVSVSHGYRSKEVHLYASKLFWAQRITSLRETILEYKQDDALDWIKDETERKATAAERITEMEKTLADYEQKFTEAED